MVFHVEYLPVMQVEELIEKQEESSSTESLVGHISFEELIAELRLS